MSNTTSINSELFANLVTEAQMAAYENSVARQLVTVFDAPVNTGKVLQVPLWSGVTASGLTEGTAASAANTNTTQATITLGEIGVYHQITDMLRDSAYSDVAAQIGDASGRAIAEKIDADVFGLFGSFSDDIGPGAGNELTVDHILQAAATLRSRKLTGPFYAVLNPFQAYNVKKQLTSSGASNVPALSQLGNNVLAAGYLGTVAGVQVYESALVAIDGSGDAVAGVFHPMALGSAMRGTLTYEATRQAQNRATDLMITAVTGQAVLRSTYGVALTADAGL
jgi:N4-gp56 family major capsid protein